MSKKQRRLPPLGGITTKDMPSNHVLDKMFRNAGIAETAHPNPTRWDDLDSLYFVMAGGLVQYATNVNSMVSHLKQHYTQVDQELNMTVVGVEKDLLELSSELKKIRDGHVGRKGAVANASELSMVAGIFNDYLVIKSRMEAAIVPSFVTISERCAHLSASVKKANGVEAPHANVVLESQAAPVALPAA